MLEATGVAMDRVADLRQSYRAAAISAAASSASVLVWVALVELVFPAVRSPFEGFARVPDIEPLRHAFWALAGINVALAPVLRRRLLRASPGDAEAAGGGGSRRPPCCPAPSRSRRPSSASFW
jgi:hypothetical protein